MAIHVLQHTSHAEEMWWWARSVRHATWSAYDVIIACRVCFEVRERERKSLWAGSPLLLAAAADTWQTDVLERIQLSSCKKHKPAMPGAASSEVASHKCSRALTI